MEPIKTNQKLSLTSNPEMSTEVAEQPEYDFVHKFLLVGDEYVGKSCFLSMFKNGKPTDKYIPTIGVDFGTKIMTVGGDKVKIQMWDPSGQKRFRTITNAFFRGAMAIILIFDITDLQTFHDIDNFLSVARKSSSEDVSLILVGNKLDLETKRQVDVEVAEEFARKENMPYREITSMNQDSVDEIVMEILNTMDRQKNDILLFRAASATTLPPPLPAKEEKEQCCVVS